MRTFRYINFAAMILIIATLGLQAQEFCSGGSYNGRNVRQAGVEQRTDQAGYLLGADVLLDGKWFVGPDAPLMVRNPYYMMAGVNPDDTLNVTGAEFRYTNRSLRVPLFAGLHLSDPSNDAAFNIYIVGSATTRFNFSADLDSDALEIETRQAQWYLGFGGGIALSFLYLEAGYDVAMNSVFGGETFNTNPTVNSIHLTCAVGQTLAERHDTKTV